MENCAYVPFIEPLSLAPGSYGALNVKSRSTLSLSSGNHYFTSLTMEPNSAIVADGTGGAVKLYVKSGLTFRGGLLDNQG